MTGQMSTAEPIRKGGGDIPSYRSKCLLPISFTMLFIVVAAFLATVHACQNGNILQTGLSCSQKQLIVDKHNELRNKVASGKVRGQSMAADMLEMRWDEQLARKAQQWANGCVFEHDPNLKMGGQSIGQNLAIQYSTADMFKNPDISGMIDSWFNEVYEYGYNGNYNHNTGHYSQVIWGNSNSVGCDVTYYKKDGQYNSYLVCNYSPAGNWIGQKPYTNGNRNCEKFNLYTSRSYSHLCAVDNQVKKAC